MVSDHDLEPTNLNKLANNERKGWMDKQFGTFHKYITKSVTVNNIALEKI